MCKVIYHVGETIRLRDRAVVGKLSLSNNRLVIDGPVVIDVPLAHIESAELFRLHNTSRMVKVVHEQGILFFAVIRFSLFGFFAVVNFFRTGEACNILQQSIHQGDAE